MMILIYITLFSMIFSINPPANGGPIPKKYLDFFKTQQVGDYYQQNGLSRGGDGNARTAMLRLDMLTNLRFAETRFPRKFWGRTRPVEIEENDKSGALTTRQPKY